MSKDNESLHKKAESFQYYAFQEPACDDNECRKVVPWAHYLLADGHKLLMCKSTIVCPWNQLDLVNFNCLVALWNLDYLNHCQKDCNGQCIHTILL